MLHSPYFGQNHRSRILFYFYFYFSYYYYYYDYDYYYYYYGFPFFLLSSISFLCSYSVRSCPLSQRVVVIIYNLREMSIRRYTAYMAPPPFSPLLPFSFIRADPVSTIPAPWLQLGPALLVTNLHTKYNK